MMSHYIHLYTTKEYVASEYKSFTWSKYMKVLHEPTKIMSCICITSPLDNSGLKYISYISRKRFLPEGSTVFEKLVRVPLVQKIRMPSLQMSEGL